MRLVVVGGVAAGLSAASRARRLDSSLEIVVLEKGERISYGACGLPYFIEGRVRSIDDLTVYKPEFFERERNIRIRTRTEASAIRHSSRELVLASGERLRYDRLIWTAGARPAQRAPARHDAAQCDNDARLFSLHTDEDALRLDKFLRDKAPKRAAVVGGGYIGLEMAGALRTRGLEVTLIENGKDLLQRGDAHLTQTIVERLERCRVEVRLGENAGDPRELPHDLILWSAGLKPNVEIPAEAGVELGRTGAIHTDDRMETALRGVYAAGDCCETNHVVSGKPCWIPLGTTAQKTGRVAGANSTGGRERFGGVAGTSIVKVCGLGVGVTGLSENEARQCGFRPVSARVEAFEKARYLLGRKVEVTLTADAGSGRLLGATVTGDEGVLARLNTVVAALHARMGVEQLAGLDLAYAPPYAPVMDPVLVAAQQLLRDL
jgi:NADPH-dependent 2,4-dienoyl-CoA reductase/sulfur reductase-like enzyme